MIFFFYLQGITFIILHSKPCLFEVAPWIVLHVIPSDQDKSGRCYHWPYASLYPTYLASYLRMTDYMLFNCAQLGLT